jgi:glutamate synthase (NADPH/NADH) small chain
MAAEGITFKTGVNVGVDVKAEELNKNFDAVLYATGSTRPRDLPVPGRDLEGVHFAMDFLTKNTKSLLNSIWRMATTSAPREKSYCNRRWRYR